MNSFINRLVVVLAASLLMVSSRAEENGGSVLSPISSNTLSGYVLSYISGNNTNVPPAYLHWLIGKRQAALNAFNQEYATTRGFWGNMAVLQMRLTHYRLVWVSGQTPMPINPISALMLSGGAYFDNSGFAYFDPPSLFSGPGGSLLMPDNRVLRLAKRQTLRTLQIGYSPFNPRNPSAPIPPQPIGGTNTSISLEVSRIRTDAPPLPPVILPPAGAIRNNLQGMPPRLPRP